MGTQAGINWKIHPYSLPFTALENVVYRTGRREGIVCLDSNDRLACPRSNSGRNVTGVTKPFLIQLKTPAQEGTQTWYLHQGQEPVVRHIIGPRGESTTVTSI